MSYRVQLAPKAAKYLRGLPKKIAGQIIAKLGSLAATPRPRGCEKIKADRERFRIRAGNYRIIYRYTSEQNSVYLVTVIHGSRLLKENHLTE